MALIPTPGAFGPDRWPPPSIVTGAGVPGASGSKVTSRPPPAAVHWSTVGQAIACNARVPSIVTGIGSPGNAGSNVSSRPTPSAAVHWSTDGHATASKPPAVGADPKPSGSMITGNGDCFASGSKVISA